MTIEFMEQGTKVVLDVWDSAYAVPREDEHVALTTSAGQFFGRVTNVTWVGGVKNGGTTGLQRIRITVIEESEETVSRPLETVG